MNYDLSIPGWMSEPELQWLFDTASKMDSVVELGCYQGRSTFALLQGCKGPVYAVDTWQDFMGTGADNLGLFRENLRARLEAEAFLRLMTYPGTTAQAAIAWDDLKISRPDMVFVDADHLEAGVLQDLTLWTPRAKRLICGHDYGNSDWPDVKTVVDRFFGENRVSNPVGLIWAVELPLGAL